MPGFRIEPVYHSHTLRILYGPGEQRALALILANDDGTVCLFPTRFTNLPAPLTGASQDFPDVASVKAYLGVVDEAEAA